ncbi:DNA-processing protein DprA [Rhodomicrobium sp. Az07]|uniref:DNA-processing protein DprA n=1 Tax=Rhodomicrobium sp. Az07 TaxID=2839034 RepID=UPI001BE9EEEF|nr:DNA-processing protein DprA [Rhodomicrobium sp. Az07]MBT3072090.1 DNA-processing protein DprA [Rhodomicrobium sp. Az07]
MKQKSARKPRQRKAPEEKPGGKATGSRVTAPRFGAAAGPEDATGAEAAATDDLATLSHAANLLPEALSVASTGLGEPGAEFDYSPEPSCDSRRRGAPTPTEKRDRLRLIRTPHIGTVTFWQLVAHFESAAAAIEALPEFAKHGSRVSPRSVPSIAAAEAEMERAATAGLTLVAIGEAGYPPLLAEIEAPPPLLYIKGDPRIWLRPSFGIVGSRNASGAGLKFTAEISAELSRLGLLVVSGLARGIDGAAHRGALPFGTCAVLPGGLDRIYPPEHVGLAADIAENGLLVGECAPGFVARAQEFPRRNRIISGASLGVLVVEAAERSGSLITARLAGEQGREVFAVPGHPLDTRATGTNRLIKEGAVLTTSAEDIMAALKDRLDDWARFGVDVMQSNEEQQPAVRDESPVRAQGDPIRRDPKCGDGLGSLDETIADVLQLLSFSPIAIDDLCRMTGKQTREVHAAIVSLDLAGRLERRGSSHIVLRA